MLPSPDLDPETRTFCDYLQNYLNDETESTDPLEEYYLFISGRKDLLETDDPLKNPVLSTVIPLLSRILHSEKFNAEYASFLSQFLELLPMKITWYYFTQDEMLKAIDYPSPTPLFTSTVDLVARKISGGDADALDFLNNSSFLAKVCSRCLSDHSLTEKFWSTEPLVMSCDEKKLDEIVPDLMHATDLVSLQSDYALTFRYVNVAEIVIKRRRDLQKEQFDKIVAVVDPEKYFDENEEDPDDPLLHALIVDFYTRIVPVIDELEAFFLLLQPYILNMIRVLAKSIKSRAVDLQSRLDDVFGNLTFCILPSVILWIHANLPIKEILANLDLKIPLHLSLWEKTNPKVVPDKKTFFEQQFASLDLPTMDLSRFSIVLNAIRDPEFFDLFAKNNKFSSTALAGLPKDYLYKLLENMSIHQHSAAYLLQEMPYAVQNYLVDANTAITNRQIRLSLRSTLENLISDDKLDRGVWDAALKDLRKRLLYGRSRGPQVDVLDEAY